MHCVESASDHESTVVLEEITVINTYGKKYLSIYRGVGEVSIYLRGKILGILIQYRRLQRKGLPNSPNFEKYCC